MKHWKMMRKGIHTFAVIMIALLPVQQGWCSAAEQERAELPPQPLTMDNAVAFGLERNRVLHAVQKEVQAVREQVRQAQADFFPKLDGSYTLTHLKDVPYATLGFSGAIVGAPPQFPTATQTTNRWQLELTQPLFTGFALTSRLNISKLDHEIAEYRLEETRLNVIRDVRYGFLQALLGGKLLEVARENVRSLEVQRRNAEANYRQGLVARNDVLKADVALAQAQQRERSAAKQLVLLKSRLNQLFDLELQTRLELAETSVVPQAVPSLDSLYALAEEMRPEVKTLDTSIRQTQHGITAAKSRYYPRLSAFAQYYREGEDFLAGDNPFANNENAAIGLRVDWNLFEGGKTRAATRELLHRQKSLEERLQELKQQIRLQVEDAYEQLQVAKANMETSEVALKQAEENERMTSIQYREQLVIFLEVLNAQVFLSQSRVDYYQALYGYALALADLERAVGGPIQTQGRKKS